MKGKGEEERHVLTNVQTELYEVGGMRRKRSRKREKSR